MIYKGKASRKVIVELDKINRIPYTRQEREVRILSRAYSHKILFGESEVLGLAEMVNGIHQRKENIEIEEDSTLLAIDRRVIEDYLDDYIIGRFKSYLSRKYPGSYEELCEDY